MEVRSCRGMLPTPLILPLHKQSEDDIHSRLGQEKWGEGEIIYHNTVTHTVTHPRVDEQVPPSACLVAFEAAVGSCPTCANSASNKDLICGFI